MAPAAAVDREARRRAWWLCAPALALFLALMVVPLVMTFVLSFHSFGFYTGIEPTFGLHNYLDVLGDSYFHEIFARTFGIALVTTLLCAAIGTPEAYILYRMRSRWRSALLLVVIGPLLISVVVRTLGWAILMGNRGVINTALMNLELIDRPIKMMYTPGGIVIALVHVMVPFMVIAVWAALHRQDPATEQAAESLGAGPLTIFFRVVLPQAMPGVLSGSLIVFSLSASAFATPAILGGRRVKVVSTTVYDEFLNTLNWPLGAAIAILLLVAVLLVMVSYNRVVERRFSQVFG
ncbi:putative spermidine/putrescine transport system permease protein [Tistlia consotensis]|uniref:Putative spermidine/putrescine transport system permease protein n=1 Tax=Tistlia consotensis USBA 355 TaxID=560819 RepID=A0A1Y6CNB3_9PROT|nr:ABC transporter permease [Tistlia consotensis]SMF77061.1 putative spermidine/putrescine transport system permease protein [Tistlia consotensis USBA 355]SNS14016.1 putative spermidine/putrescine transport system permease protein [Tistlia consotensis]